MDKGDFWKKKNYSTIKHYSLFFCVFFLLFRVLLRIIYKLKLLCMTYEGREIRSSKNLQGSGFKRPVIFTIYLLNGRQER